MLGIELDDDSHERKERRLRDIFVNGLFAATGIPLLRLHIREVERMVEKLSEGWQQHWQTLAACAPLPQAA